MKFKLYSSCFPVSGKERCVVLDLQKMRFTVIPHALYEILTEFSGYSKEELVRLYGSRKVLTDYFEFLEKEGLGFWTATPENFPSLSRTWERPEPIIQSEVEVFRDLDGDYFAAIEELEALQACHLEVSFQHPPDMGTIEYFFERFSRSGFQTIDMVVPYPTSKALKRWMDLWNLYPKFNVLLLYDAPFNSYHMQGQVIATKKNLKTLKGPKEEYTGISDLIITESFFLESQEHNPFFNRKVAIDGMGNIKNASHLDRYYGNIARDKIPDIVHTQEFQRLWYIPNEKIVELKDWELRYCWLNTKEPHSLDEDLFTLKN